MTNARTFEGPRGLQGYLRLDTLEGTEIEVQESSAIMSGTQGGPFTWLRIDGGSAHLHHTEVRALRDALNVALDEPTETPSTIPARRLCIDHLNKPVSVTHDGKTYKGILHSVSIGKQMLNSLHIVIVSNDNAVIVGALNLAPDHEVTVR